MAEASRLGFLTVAYTEVATLLPFHQIWHILHLKHPRKSANTKNSSHISMFTHINFYFTFQVQLTNGAKLFFVFS